MLDPRGPLTRDQRATLLCAAVAAGMFTALAYHRLLSVDLYPLNTFLFDPDDRFKDLRHGWSYFAEWRTLAEMPWPITPGPLTVIYRWLGMVIWPVALGIVEASLVLAFFAACWRGFAGASRKVRLARSVALTALSYPVWFALDRANLEVFVFAVSWAAVETFRARRLDASAALLGLAVALKPFPAALLLLFVAERRWRGVAIAAVVAMALTAASRVYLVRFTPFDYAPFADATRRYVEHYVYGNDGFAFGHSAFGLVKTVVCKLSPSVRVPGRPAGDATLAALVLPYQVLAGLVALGLAAWAWRARPEPWRIVTAACCAVSLLPVVSADYRLLNFVIPAMLFVRDAPPSRRDALWVLLFAALLSPRAYDHYVFERLCHVRAYEVTSAAVTSPLLLTALLVLAVAAPSRRPSPGPATP